METKSPKTETTNHVLNSIEKIATQADDSKLGIAFMKRCAPAARIVAEYLECSEIQAILFSVVCNLNFKRVSVDVDDISSYLECPPIKVMKYITDFEALCISRILRRDYVGRSARGRRSINLQQIQYIVNKDLIDAILKNEKFTARKSEKLDRYGFLEAVKELIDEKENGKSTFDEMNGEINRLMEENRHQEWIRELSLMDLGDSNVAIYLYMCYSFITDNTAVDLGEMLKTILPDLRDQITVRKELIESDNILVRKDMVELEDGFFRTDRSVCLTEYGINFFLQEDRKVFTQKKEKSKMGLIPASEIVPKRLYFSREEEEKLKFLTSTLMPSNHARLSARMRQAGMKEGVAVLLYGPPGTGKTESAYQLARRTGRNVKQVIISETKSMWFGQSEKLIKGIFDNYRKLVENSKVAPILLFNEADAIFSSRKQIGNSSVDQTENAIQNIILQEMEDLKGILVATTNLTQNLDKAFERRFLYKILFEIPTPEIMASIWRSKIKGLKRKDASMLAQHYQLSGGQIDNVVRKCLMNRVLHGDMPSMDEIMALCTDEVMERQQYSRIGFQFHKQKQNNHEKQ